jgi:hypothetical protein
MDEDFDVGFDDGSDFSEDTPEDKHGVENLEKIPLEHSERTPFSHSVTIPSNTALPHSLRGECICYYVKPELHKIGLIEKATTFGNNVRCYMERTICDLLRSRNRCDEETVINCIKNYVKSNDKDLNLLALYLNNSNLVRC